MDNQTIIDQQNQQDVPNATAVLVLGIISIAMCWCYGIIGLTCGIIALVLSSKAKKAIAVSPGLYKESSIKNMNAGRICAIIGTILSGLYIAFVLIYVIAFGAMMTQMPWDQIMKGN